MSVTVINKLKLLLIYFKHSKCLKLHVKDETNYVLIVLHNKINKKHKYQNHFLRVWLYQ